MKIAYIVPSLDYKGPVIVVKELCEGLTKLGHTCKVFYFDDIVEIYLPCEAERISIFSRIDLSEFDIVHSHMLRPDLWAFANKLFTKNKRSKYVSTIHQKMERPYFDQLTTKFIALELAKVVWQRILKIFDSVVVLTPDHLTTLNNVDIDRVSIIYNGLDVDMSCEPDAIDKDAILKLKSKYPVVVGSNSLINKRKGLDQVIRSLVDLKNYCFVMVGDGPDVERLKSLAQSLGVIDQCLWLGFKKKGYRYYRLFDIYVIPSYSEGFPLSLIEASAYGMPCLCSDIKLFRTIFKEAQVTFTPLEDIEAFVKSLKQTYTNREHLSTQLRAFYVENLTQSKMCCNHIDLYSSLF